MNTKITKQGWKIGENDSHLGKWVEESGNLCHDEFLPYCSDPWIKSGDTVIDIGANIGTHTIHYSELVGRSGRVLALEPGRVAYECLEHNAQLFKFKNVITANYGVSDIASFAHHVENENLGASSCIPVNNGEVILCPLDFLIRIFSIDSVDFIKIDAEGYEMLIIKGALKTLKTFRPTILMEINADALRGMGTQPFELIDFLGDLGYSFFCVNLGLGPTEPQYDVICECIG